MSKRPFDMAAFRDKKQKMDKQLASTAAHAAQRPKNPYLQHPIEKPERTLAGFLLHARTAARNYIRDQKFPVSEPFCEVEARLGVLYVHNRRVCSSGAKHVEGRTVPAFECTALSSSILSGLSRSHFVKWTASGISEVSPLSSALGVSVSANLKRDLVEEEYAETVYTGYANDGRIAVSGVHDPRAPMQGKMESKDKLVTLDLTLPAASYDVRVTLSSEKILDPAVSSIPPGWKSQRIKRRRSYSRRDKSIAWQIDVTEVTTNYPTNRDSAVDYELELELRESVMLQLINEENQTKLQQMTAQLAGQLWWILSQLNPLTDVIDVEECLQDHPDKHAVNLALAQCGAFKRFMDGGCLQYDSPLANPNDKPNPSLTNVKFVGCMPVNFSRHNIEEIQRSPANAYYLSEKTDGVRHFLVFTDKTAVLVDRAMRGKRPIPLKADEDPFSPLLGRIRPGTVLDGEVVMNRKQHGKPRPIFIVFDVMAVSATEAVLHLPFEQRLHHLQRSSFAKSEAVFDPSLVDNRDIALPLVRKNFVQRTALDQLLTHVVEERGVRCFKKGELHYHMTDGIIFQPNRPYVLGTDVNLLKWKYLDTVTIDVQIMENRHNDDDDVLRLGCLGEEQTPVDMTRHIHLPRSERLRLEADRFESHGTIAEVGFDPEVGEWYYLTMRADKIAPNHISTVLGTLMELAESLTTDELRYRMAVPPGTRDTYRKDMRGMLKQLLDHQRRTLSRGAAR